MSSSLGTLFRVSTFGESHGIGVGAIVDGCPAGLQLSEADIQPQLDRRRPGQSDLTTPREEADQVTILSGVENGLTLGTPIGLLVHNKDQRPGDYGEMDLVPRPSHADFTYQAKYGIRASSGGGRSSARETIGRVAAGAIAEKILREEWGVEIVAWVSSVGAEEAVNVDVDSVSRDQVDSNLSRCPDKPSAARMEALVREVLEAKDSVGGVVSCVCRNLPAGWGEPVFDKLDAMLAQAMLSLPATKGFEIGSGFAGTRLRGSQHNDPFRAERQAPGYADQLCRRHPRRHLQRRAGPVPGGVQAGRNNRPVSADSRLRWQTGHSRGQGPSRPLRGAACRADRRVDGGAGAA